MRKHFLLLFLMALLPLAGWADAVNLNTVAVNITLSNTYSDGAYQLEYTGATTAPGLNALTISGTEIDINTWDDLYEFEYFASATAETPLTDFKKAGTYWVGIKAKEGNTNYTGSCATANRVKAIINKATLHITLQNAEKVYGAADPTSLQVVPVSGLKGNDDINGIGVTFVQEEGDYPLPRQNKKAVGTWNYTFTTGVVSEEITATNYDIILDANPTLEITPAVLTVYYAPDDEENPTKSSDIVKKYNGSNGFTIDADEDNLTVVGWKYTDEETVDLGDLTLTPTATTANVGPDGDDEEDLLDDKTAHAVTIALSEVSTNGTIGNYTVTYVHPALYVQQATITADDFTFAQTTPNFTYDGAAHIPAGITVKYMDNSDEDNPVVLETLTQGAENDFTINYLWRATGSEDDYGEDTHGNTFAGSYQAYVSAVAGGNYYTEEDLPVEALDYIIKQRGLTVYAGDYAPTYTGAAASLTDVEIGWSGLTLADIEALDEAEKDVDDYFEVKFIDDDDAEMDAPTNAGSYKVMTFAKEAFADTDLATNYEPSYGKANYTIQKKAATITAAAQSITFGEDVEINSTVSVQEDENDDDYTVTFSGIVDDDADAVVAKLQLTLDPDQEYNAVADYTEAIVVDSIAGTVANVLDNYQITFVPGTFSITASTFTVYAKTNSKVYGTAYTLDAEGGFDYGKINFSGTWPEGVTVTYQLKATEDGDALTELPKAVGTYYIVPVVNNWPTEGTDYAEPQIQMGIFKITKKTVYIKPNALNLNNGVTEDVLATLGSVKYYSDEDCENETALAYKSDKIEYTLGFYVDEDDDESVTLGDDDELDCTEGETYEHGIVVTVPDAADVQAGYANNNYDIHVAYGAITILNANTLVISNTDANMYNKIQLAAEACDPDDEDTFWDVTFSVGRTLKANKWESFVLPFEVSVGQLSAALKAAAGQNYGYAIFNVYNESTSDASNVRFSLNMTNIPANTPFLVKTEKDVVLGSNVIIEDVCIVDPGSANPTKEVANKVTMVGCYEDTPITKNDFFFYQGAWQNGAESTTDPTILPATMAYWTPAGGPKARVFVEDFENGTTVIKEISAETMREIAADGWYTVNGIKLQSIPTEKGVYINNGKKVVIK